MVNYKEIEVRGPKRTCQQREKYCCLEQSQGMCSLDPIAWSAEDGGRDREPRTEILEPSSIGNWKYLEDLRIQGQQFSNLTMTIFMSEFPKRE